MNYRHLFFILLSLACTTPLFAQIQQVLKEIKSPNHPLHNCIYTTTEHFDCLVDSTDESLFYRRDVPNPEMVIEKTLPGGMYLPSGDLLESQWKKEINQVLQSLLDDGLLSKRRMVNLSKKQEDMRNISYVMALVDEEGIIRYVYFRTIRYSGDFLTDKEMTLIYDRLIGKKLDFSVVKKPIVYKGSEAGKPYQIELYNFFVELGISFPNSKFQKMD